MSYRAVVIGATGAVGGALVRELLASSACARVVALTRRPAEGLPPSSKLTVHVVPFDALQERTAELASGCELAFCTMGVGQPRKVAFDEFWRVDVEYAGAFARGAAAAGVRHLSLLSSVGANLSSRNPYLRVKGVAEQIVERAGIGIARTSLFRPSLLVTRELRYGLQDRLTQRLFPLIAPLLPNRYHQVRVEDLARAMRVNAERAGPHGVEVLEYPDVIRLLRES
jgi:uncharacterized protein YbjT (DUF2867 family)